ncbi:pterocarpan synthase 1 [Andrographis paniculata]|uniref:pterocarpan synthase 1 n=1 Tax=Andrographis paniculata TaxID=175694 RepID=UPI0021E8F911|nr:pterocarpan synthase 1 [Andrographis paniculata]
MLSRIIYCTAVVLATAVVILLALFSPQPYTTNPTGPLLALSFYIQQPHFTPRPTAAAPPPPDAALIFHRTLTEGPENTSRVVGNAQGFIIPVESFAHSAFNIVYLTFQTEEFSGSVSVEAKNYLAHKEDDEIKKMDVVGGTGAFAFARGHAFFAKEDNLAASYVIKLHLKFPVDRSYVIPG